MSFLDTLLQGYKLVQSAGTALFPRNILNFASGATVVDNPVAGSTDVTILPTGVSTQNLYVSIVDMVNGAGAAGIANNSGARSAGIGFAVVQQNHYCTGARFIWAGGATTVKLSVWSTAGTRLATVNVTVTGAGTYSGTFATPLALTAGTVYALTMWDTAGSPHYTSYNGSTSGTAPLGNILPASGQNETVLAGPFAVYCGSSSFAGVAVISDVYGIYATTDVAPSTNDTTKFNPIEPMLL